jgi:hypothetical protein
MTVLESKVQCRGQARQCVSQRRAARGQSSRGMRKEQSMGGESLSKRCWYWGMWTWVSAWVYVVWCSVVWYAAKDDGVKREAAAQLSSAVCERVNAVGFCAVQTRLFRHSGVAAEERQRREREGVGCWPLATERVRPFLRVVVCKGP